MGFANDGRTIHRHVHNATPGAQYPHTPQGRNHGNARFHHMLHHRQIAAPCVRIIAVQIAAEDKPALVGLRDIEMPDAKDHNIVDHRLDAFRHKGLQHMAFDGKAEPRHFGDMARMTRRRQPQLVAADKAA